MVNLRVARQKAGLTQQQMADRLGVSQAYWAYLECGRRRLTQPLARRVVRELQLPPTALPLDEPGSWSPGKLARALGGLGYPGFGWLRRAQPRNPAVVLVAALRQENLEAREVEALPWLLVHYPHLDWDWVVTRLKLADVQNRLGFLLELALARNPGSRELAELARVRARLERARLAREDTLCQGAMSEAERAWVREHRGEAARRWNLLTDLRPEHLAYAG